MVQIFRGYVQTKDKKPIQKFKGIDNLPTLEEVEKYDEYAGILNNDFTVMDVDDSIEAEKTYQLVCDLDLNCRVTNTSRGKHFIFKKNKYASKGNTHQLNALGFTIDIRTGVNQYIVVKKDGKVREIVRDFDESKPITEYPKFFAPIDSKNTFTGMGDGDGRNGKLFGHIATLSRCGFTRDEVIDICHYINSYAFSEPLSDTEMKSICRSESFDNLNISSVAEEFGVIREYKPSNYSDLAMAELFSHHYKDELRYNPGTDWLVWNGKVWEMSELKAQKKYIEFLKKVLSEAQKEVKAAYGGFEPDKEKIAKAQAFYNFVVRMSDSGKISSVLKIARSYLEIDIKKLDANPFDLNTPDGIVDLRSGLIRDHDSKAFCTKITDCSPNDKGDHMWKELLNTVTVNNQEYIDFLQVACGASVVGKVYNEALMIAYGDGHNGKSTLFNTIFNVLGDYSGKIPAEALTTRGGNTKVSLAELFGKRFVLASETEEGQKLSNQMLKQIASTDAITAERKYKDPFVFQPSHTALLYTNFLPALGSLDNGTKRRIIICPFNATITKPQKDFAEKLLEVAGGSVMTWLIEGAKKFIALRYTLPSCSVCEVAKTEYVHENDWLNRFISDCCNVGDLEQQAGGVLYKAYKQWCQDVGEYPKRNRDFANALESRGYTKKITKKCSIWHGLSLAPDRVVGRTLEEDFI